MRSNVHNIKNTSLFILLITLLIFPLFIFSQNTGDYQTVSSGGNLDWDDPASWQYYDGGWDDATSYPGENDIVGNGVVTILSSGTPTVSMNVTSAYPIGELVIESGATLEFYSAGGDFSLDVNGDITNNGTITSDDGGFAEHTILLAGNFDNTNGTFNGDKLGGAEAEIINFNFDGTGDMTISGSPTFFKLTYSDGGGEGGSLTTSSSSIVIKNSLDVTTDAGDFILGTGGLIIEGETINILGTDFTASTNSTLTFQGTSVPTLNTDITPFDLYNLVVKDADLTLDGDGEFNITNRLTLTGTEIIFDGSESLSYDANATLVYNGTSGTQYIGSEWTGGGTPVEPDNVIINNADGVEISGNRSIDGNLSLTNGELYHDAGSGSLTVNGNVIGGSGSYGLTNAGTLILNGASTSEVTVSNTLSLYNITVNKTDNSDVYVTVQSGATINIDDGAEVYIQEGTLKFSTASQLVLGTGNILDIDNIGRLETGGTDISGFATFDLAEGSVIRFTGTNNETVPSATYGNLTINKTSGSAEIESGGITLIQNASYNSILYVQNGTLNLSNQTITLSGTGGQHILQIGASGILRTADASGSTDGTDITGFNDYQCSGLLVFNGNSDNETIPTGVSGDAFNLTVNKVGGSLLTAGAITIGGSGNILSLNNGIINVSSGNLTLASGTSISGGSNASYVEGTLLRIFSDDNEGLLPIGNNGYYRPIRITFDNLSGTSTITAQQIESAPTAPSGLPAGISGFATGLNRYWTITESGATSFDGYLLDLVYTGTTDPQSSLTIISGTNADQYTTAGIAEASPPANRVQATFTAFSDFALARTTTEIVWNGSVSSAWSNPSNWIGGQVPQTGDIVSFTGDYSSTGGIAEYNTSTTQSEFASINLNPSGGNIQLTLTKTTLNLTATTNALVVTSGNKLIFNGTNVQMGGASYNSDRTDYQSGSDIEYTSSASVHVDNYNGNLTINGAESSTGSGSIAVGGDLTKSNSTDFTSSHTITVAGNYENATGSGNATFSGGGLTVEGSTTINAGTVGGTIYLESTSISFGGGNFAGTVTLSGSGQQTISGTAPSFNNLIVDNSSSAGIEIADATTVSGTLTLTDGVITTTETDLLTLTSSASISGGSESSFINGPMANTWPSSGSSTKVFALGKSTTYRPLEISISSSGSQEIRAEVFNADAGGDPGALDAISIARYYKTNIISGSVGNVARAKITFGSDDGVQVPGNLVVARSTLISGTYNSIGRSAGDGTSVTSDTYDPTEGDDYLLLGSTGDNSLPVELAAFEALADFGKVELTWTTASESNNLGFNIYKTVAGENSWNKLNSSLIDGQGTASYASDYSFVDSKVIAGETYQYKLKSISVNGLAVEEKIVEVSVPIPDQYVLFNNYPNPFNPTTNIKFQLPEAQQIRLKIYDLNGSLVKTLSDNNVYPSGEHIISWNATDNAGNRVATGIYLYQFQAGKFVKTGKMVLVK